MRRDLISPALLPHVLAARSRFARAIVECRRRFGRETARHFLQIVHDAKVCVVEGVERDILENNEWRKL